MVTVELKHEFERAHSTIAWLEISDQRCKEKIILTRIKDGNEVDWGQEMSSLKGLELV